MELNVKSPPARGAWIEMLQQQKAVEEEFVAPRTGGVD